MVLLVQEEEKREEKKKKYHSTSVSLAYGYLAIHVLLVCSLPVLFQGFPTQFYVLLRQGRMKIPLPISHAPLRCGPVQFFLSS